MFKDVGITMNLKVADGQTFNAQYYARQWADAGNGEMIQGFSTTAPSGNGYFYDSMHSRSRKNYFGLSDPQIDEWADQQRSELDPATRKATQRKIWDRMLSEVLRLDGQPVTFSPTMMQPWVRYYRWNGPYIAIHSYYDWGYGYHQAWVDK
jgi:ABC-type transport system substrate-binding protein